MMLTTLAASAPPLAAPSAVSPGIFAAYISLAALVYAVYVILVKPLRFRHHCIQQGIPFLPFRPVFGQLPEFANRDPKPIPASEPAPLGPANISPLLWKWRCQLGTVFGISLGIFQPIVVAEPDLLHQIMIAKNSTFGKNQNARRVVDFLANGLVFSEGEFWARQRKMISPAFSPAYIKHAVTIMDEQASIAVQQWVHAVTQASLPTTDGNGSGSGSGSVPASSGSGVCEIDMYAAFTTLALDIIGLAAFGSTVSTAKTVGGGGGEEKEREGLGGLGGSEKGSLEEEEEEGSVREVYEAVDTLSTRSTERMFSGRLAIPFYTWLPTQENRALWHAGERVRRLSLDLIARRRSSQAREPGKDLLAVMLAARDDVSNEQMTDQQLVDECVTFLVAGHETTAKLLTWAVYLLARHPEWQRRLREEALRVMGGGEKGKGNNGEGNEEGETGEGEGVGKQGEGNRGGMKVMWQHVGQLREMHMVLQETLRLFPPTPVISREASKDTSLGPYSIPAGTRIMMAIAMVQSDPRFWGEDALEFNPLRFKDGVQGACSHPQAFVPFSAGPRDCIGSNFALTEAKVVLAHLLRHLEWELSPTYVHLPINGITLSPKYGMPLRMRLVE
ncbi:hypothetical protein CLOM_g250 [Closterium sp. NIES-68]|nr:hypothetical protein CLOM_g250 [Closterium sp. NIES-68]